MPVKVVRPSTNTESAQQRMKRLQMQADFIRHLDDVFDVTTTVPRGRLGNQIFRNLAVSFIAEKNDLYCKYSSSELIDQLGIKLFSGNNKWNNTIKLTNVNYLDILHKPSLESNLNSNKDYFQTKEVSHMIYKYFHNDSMKSSIINHNSFKARYNTNNDLFIHMRLGDIQHFSPGINYYLKAISNITSFNKMYICTDSEEHSMVHQLIQKYPKAIIEPYNETTILQFGSTCNHVILSHGSFSAIIGYLSFFSDITYPVIKVSWFGDIFSIPTWKRINF